MLGLVAGSGFSPQLAVAMRAGACTLLGTLRRVLSAPASASVGGPQSVRSYAALAATGYPSPDAPQFQYAVLDAPLMQEEGAPAAGTIPRHLRPYAQRMASLGGRRAAGREATYEAAVTAAHAGQPFAVVLGTGGTEAAALELAGHYYREYRKARQALAGEVPHEPMGKLPGSCLPPLLLVAHPYANSLPSALEALARMQQDWLRGRVVYLGSAAAGSPQGDEGWAKLESSLHSVRVWHRLHRSRIGLVGPPSPWLVASTPTNEAVSSAWGPTLVDVDMQDLMGALWGTSSFKKAEVDAVVADMMEPAGSGSTAHTHTQGGEAACREECSACGTAVPAPADPAAAAKVYLALRRLVDEHKLACVTVRCFDIVSGKETTGCYSLSRLLDEDVVAGCEGDVCSALGMLWGRLMTGQVPWMANVAQVDAVNGVLKLAHCTIARSLLTSHEATTHFESGLGVAIKGTIPPGSVTLLRIGGQAMDQLWVEEGYALREEAGREGEWSPQLCRTQVRVSLLGGRDVVERLLQRPLGNHVVMLRGHQKTLLEGYFRQFGPGSP